MPKPAPTLLAKPYSLIAKRGLFATKHLWVTPHKEEERYPSGDWVLQGKGGEGLEQWVKQVSRNALTPLGHTPHCYWGMPYTPIRACFALLQGLALDSYHNMPYILLLLRPALLARCTSHC